MQLVLTGCRVGEILSLDWSDIKGLRLHLRDSKTGPQTVPRTVWLGDEDRDLIVALPRCGKNSSIFWNWRYQRPIQTIHSPWAKFRDVARVKDVRLHGSRHTYASHAVMGRESVPMIGRLLGHATVKSTSRYAHFEDAHLLEAAETIGAAIERAMLTGRS
ncbi:tyrosine-type recombinase/integrase [Croceicoccus pelagius]|uniref:Tyr recombinase domain-containing protein n=1 Tax=Croceicoccus pelagius TaxID=1703341 RepID=A0A917DKK6_9SPHN|nr:site-specific integrase [Croceicoccus pelagius]GGD47813.1 hypothetical protein GCM10010989_22700 [Croceicoccus pelagius]